MLLKKGGDGVWNMGIKKQTEVKPVAGEALCFKQWLQLQRVLLADNDVRLLQL